MADIIKITDKIDAAKDKLAKAMGPEHGEAFVKFIIGSPLDELISDALQCQPEGIFALNRELGENAQLLSKAKIKGADKDKVEEAYSELLEAVDEEILSILVDQCGCKKGYGR